MMLLSSSNLTELSELTLVEPTSIEPLVDDLTGRGITLRVDGDQLRASPSRLITAEDAKVIRSNKLALIDYLRCDRSMRKAELSELTELTPCYTCPGCNQRVPCAVTHPCAGLDTLGGQVPFADDFRTLYSWHLDRIRADREARS